MQAKFTVLASQLPLNFIVYMQYIFIYCNQNVANTRLYTDNRNSLRSLKCVSLAFYNSDDFKFQDHLPECPQICH